MKTFTVAIALIAATVSIATAAEETVLSRVKRCARPCDTDADCEGTLSKCCNIETCGKVCRAENEKCLCKTDTDCQQGKGEYCCSGVCKVFSSKCPQLRGKRDTYYGWILTRRNDCCSDSLCDKPDKSKGICCPGPIQPMKYCWAPPPPRRYY